MSKMKPMTIILLSVLPEDLANRGTSELVGELMAGAFDRLKEKYPERVIELQECLVRFNSPLPARDMVAE